MINIGELRGHGRAGAIMLTLIAAGAASPAPGGSAQGVSAGRRRDTRSRPHSLGETGLALRKVTEAAQMVRAWQHSSTRTPISRLRWQ